MPHYLKLFSALFFTITTLGLVGCNIGYTPDPQDDIALFQPFIDANINKKSDDPYISSTVKPGDKLYDILVNIQHGRHDVAIKLLKPLVEQGDAEAQFWMAKMIFDSSIKNITPAFNLYKKSMAQNNPFAYMMMSPGLISSGCDLYFGERYCTMDNLGKVVELFKQRAKQGDVRAQYFLLRMLKPDGSYVKDGSFAQKFHLTESAETREQYLKEVIRFAQGHYYQPLMDYVDTLLFRDQGEYKFQALTPEQYQLSMDLLTIAANNNYIPAVERLAAIGRGSLEKNDAMYSQLYQLGGTPYFRSRTYFSEEYTLKQRYVFALAFEKMSGSSKFFIGLKYEPENQIEKQALDKQADILLQKMTPMVYIDGFTSRDDWVD